MSKKNEIFLRFCNLPFNGAGKLYQNLRILNLKEDLIKPITTLNLNQPAKRPLRAGMIIDKISTELNVKPLGIDNTLNLIKSFF